MGSGCRAQRRSVEVRLDREAVVSFETPGDKMRLLAQPLRLSASPPPSVRPHPSPLASASLNHPLCTASPLMRPPQPAQFPPSHPILMRCAAVLMRADGGHVDGSYQQSLCQPSFSSLTQCWRAGDVRATQARPSTLHSHNSSAALRLRSLVASHFLPSPPLPLHSQSTLRPSSTSASPPPFLHGLSSHLSVPCWLGGLLLVAVCGIRPALGQSHSPIIPPPASSSSTGGDIPCQRGRSPHRTTSFSSRLATDPLLSYSTLLAATPSSAASAGSCTRCTTSPARCSTSSLPSTCSSTRSSSSSPWGSPSPPRRWPSCGPPLPPPASPPPLPGRIPAPTWALSVCKWRPTASSSTLGYAEASAQS